MIKRVRVKGYKSLEDVEVTLQPLTVFIGPNAAGKSNLFDALGLLSRMATSSSLDEAFKGHRGAPLEAFYFGEKGIEGLQKRGSAQFTVEVDVQLSPDVIEAVKSQLEQFATEVDLQLTPDVIDALEKLKDDIGDVSFRYSLTVEITTETGNLYVLDERLYTRTPDGVETNRLTVTSSGRFTYSHLRPTQLRISPSLYLMAFREELSRWRFYYFEPAAMREKSALRPVTSLEPSGRDLAAYFNYLKAESKAQFDAMNRALHLLIPRVDGIDVQVTSDGYLQLYVIEDGVPFPASIVSEGTLRVLGLLAVTNSLSPVSVVGYEEPENGVHPARMRLLAKLLANAADPARGRQILVNTHSPLMPSYILDELMPPLSNEGLVVNCRREGRATRFEPVEVSGPLFFGDDLDETIDDAYLPETSLVERILRGDFGG